MNRKRYAQQSIPLILVLAGVLFLPSACGTLQVGVEPTPTSGSTAVAVLPPANATRVPTWTAVPPRPTSTSSPTSSPTAVPPTSSPTAYPPTATLPPSTRVPTAVHTPQPPATPVPTVVGTPVICDDVPVRGFGKVWAEHPEVPQGLGCPEYYYYCYGGVCSGEQPMVSAVERFEHGSMIWVNRPTWSDTQWVYVLFSDGTYQRFLDTWREGDTISDTTIIPPAGLYQPIRGFGKVWREGTGAQVRDRLGWAIEPEMGGDGAWERFDRGMMFWIGAVDRIYVIYEHDPAYNPVHRYQEFKDTF